MKWTEEQLAEIKARRGKPTPAKKPRAPDPSEHQEQAALIQWWDFWCPSRHMVPHQLFAIPNGSHKSQAAAKKFQAEGLRAGVSDLFLAQPSSAAAGLFIEMKSRTGSMTELQEAFQSIMRDVGYQAIVCRSAEEAIAAIEAYLGPRD